jgi:hypothetical protein
MPGRVRWLRAYLVPPFCKRARVRVFVRVYVRVSVCLCLYLVFGCVDSCARV